MSVEAPAFSIRQRLSNLASDVLHGSINTLGDAGVDMNNAKAIGTCLGLRSLVLVKDRFLRRVVVPEKIEPVTTSADEPTSFAA